MVMEVFMDPEIRQHVFRRDRWICRTCFESVHRHGTPQIAHKIADTKSNRKMYGDAVVDHPDNLAATCCLACNSAQNIGFKTVQAAELAAAIKEKICANS